MQYQEEIDAAYSKFCTILLNEMDEYLQYRSVSRGTRKRLKLHKPFWNDELTQFWKDMKYKEHIFNKYKGNQREKTCKRQVFVNSQKVFNHELRHTGRAYNRKMLIDMDDLSTNN